MVKHDSSDSEFEETPENSSSEEPDPPVTATAKNKSMSEYEKQRLSRIAENRARLEALGLPKIASSLMGSSQKAQTEKRQKGKGKVGEDEDDEDYNPNNEDEHDDDDMDVDEDEDEDEDFLASGYRKNKVPNKSSKPKKKKADQKIFSHPDYVGNDDGALMQAIALSLQDSAGVSRVVHSGLFQSLDAHTVDVTPDEREGKAAIKEDGGQRKRKKSFSSRVQMTEDELVIHFFHFDERGNGDITIRDLRRVASAHDFTWTDREMADMIHCFDSDGDGKLSFDDFRTIVGRCNMIQGSKNP